MIFEFLNGKGEVNLSFLKLALILKLRYFVRVVVDSAHGGMNYMWLPPEIISDAVRLVSAGVAHSNYSKKVVEEEEEASRGRERKREKGKQSRARHRQASVGTSWKLKK